MCTLTYFDDYLMFIYLYTTCIIKHILTVLTDSDNDEYKLNMLCYNLPNFKCFCS